MGDKIYTAKERERMLHAKQKHALVQSTQPGPLLPVEKARQILAQSRDVDEVKDIADKAKAVATYQRVCKASIGSQNDAIEIELRAKRRLGELVKDMPKAKGAPGPGRGKAGQKAGPALGQPPTLASQGIDKRDAHQWQQLAAIPAKQFEKCIADARDKGTRIVASAVTQTAKVQKQAAQRTKKEDDAKVAPLRAELRMQDANEFLDAFEPQSIDLLLTDPPYSTDVDIAVFANWILNVTTKLKSTGRAYICIGAYPLELLTYLEMLRQAKWLDRSQVLVWTYRNTLGPSPSHDYKLNWQAILYLRGADAAPLDCPVMTEQFSVQDINAPDGRLGDRYHAWQKPDDLAERFVRHSTKPGDLVVDPFACTGTFLLAAARLGRRAIGCDISAENLKIAEQRGCLLVNVKEAA